MTQALISQIRSLTPHHALLTSNTFDEDLFAEKWTNAFEVWMQSNGITYLFLFQERQREEIWQDPPSIQSYQELTVLERTEGGIRVAGCVWKTPQRTMEDIEQWLQDAASAPLSHPLERIASEQQAVLLRPDQPWKLHTVKIPKPWGYEEWYTGVEKRGVVQIVDSHGSTELPYALGLFQPQVLAHHPNDLILLKTLNPVPDEVLGDLYLEMHEQKWEVYVVTEIDPEAWPSGRGIIKAGLHQDKVKAYQTQHPEDWQQAYLKDFQESISRYEQTRRAIDLRLDAEKEKRGFAPNALVPPDVMQAMLATVPEAQRDEERQLREHAYSFVGDCEVGLGDIVTFPINQMHALQHGIRVIEFQTPHYERLIVMFGQKVLNQNHWDTTTALSRMKPEVYHKPTLQTLDQSETHINERFVDFPDFTSDRITLQPQAVFADSTDSPVDNSISGGCTTGQYHLLIVVSGAGTLVCNGQSHMLAPGEGYFLPVSLGNYTIQSANTEPLVYLKAMPTRP